MKKLSVLFLAGLFIFLLSTSCFAYSDDPYLAIVQKAVYEDLNNLKTMEDVLKTENLILQKQEKRWLLYYDTDLLIRKDYYFNKKNKLERILMICYFKMEEKNYRDSLFYELNRLFSDYESFIFDKNSYKINLKNNKILYIEKATKDDGKWVELIIEVLPDRKFED